MLTKAPQERSCYRAFYRLDRAGEDVYRLSSNAKIIVVRGSKKRFPRAVRNPQHVTHLALKYP
jgi:hypothetical protein